MVKTIEWTICNTKVVIKDFPRQVIDRFTSYGLSLKRVTTPEKDAELYEKMIESVMTMLVVEPSLDDIGGLLYVELKTKIFNELGNIMEGIKDLKKKLDNSTDSRQTLSNDSTQENRNSARII